MPTTIGGVLLFIAFLTPGFVYYIQRRRFVELPSESALLETARLLGVSVFANLIALLVFTLVRELSPSNTPSPSRLMTFGWRYVDVHPALVFLWCTLLYLIAIGVAFLAAQLSHRIDLPWFAPDIVDESTWNVVLADRVPPGSSPYLTLELCDGSSVSGYLSWFSTALAENEDRELALYATSNDPIIVTEDGVQQKLSVNSVVLSARRIERLLVTYVTSAPAVSRPRWWNYRWKLVRRAIRQRNMDVQIVKVAPKSFTATVTKGTRDHVDTIQVATGRSATRAIRYAQRQWSHELRRPRRGRRIVRARLRHPFHR
jgi:Family of unknown function (DUF6338)